MSKLRNKEVRARMVLPNELFQVFTFIHYC